MEVLVKIAQLLLSLSILVVLHELGHFLFAKLFKTRVEKFYLFFDPWFSLLKYKKGDTEYGLGWLPLGGYVKISGMIDESMDKEQMKQPPQPHEFRSKPAWQRLLIMCGGVFVNFILALFIYSIVLYAWGNEYLPNSSLKYGITCDSLGYSIGFRNGDKILTVGGKEIDDFQKITHDILLNTPRDIVVQRGSEQVAFNIPDSTLSKLIKNPLIIIPRFPYVVEEVVKDSPALKAGFKKGDILLAINGEPKQFNDEFREAIKNSKNKNLNVTVKRGNDTVSINVLIPNTGIVGTYAVSPLKFLDTKKQTYSFFESIPAGITRGMSTLSSYIKQFKLIFSPKTKAYESVGGFITIGSIFPGTWDWQSFWNLTAFLSMILAFMNILPIPALDGGHVLFLLFEMITGRKPSDKFLEYAQITGMIILLSLLVFANGNDIVGLLHKWKILMCF
jgi:regulator of sigma E protease